MPIIHTLVHHIADAISGRNTQQTYNTHHTGAAVIPAPHAMFPLVAPAHAAHPRRGCCRRDRRRARRDCRRSHWCSSCMMTPVYLNQQVQQQPPYVHVTVEAPEMATHGAHSGASVSGQQQESGVEVRETGLPPAYAQGSWNPMAMTPEKEK